MASEADDLAIGHLKREFSARVSAFADLQDVTSKCDWRPDRVTVRFNRPDAFTAGHDVERATVEYLHNGCFRVSLSVAGTLRLLSAQPLSFVRCCKMKSSAPPTAPASPGSSSACRLAPKGANEILNQAGAGITHGQSAWLAHPEWPGAILSAASRRTAMGWVGELRRGNE